MQAVLFVCSYNSVRSPMAAAILKKKSLRPIYIQSAGIELKDVDGYAISVLKEKGIDITHHEGQKLSDIRDRNFDIVITLSRYAHQMAKQWIEGYAIALEYWPVDEPSYAQCRDDTLVNFRQIRDEISRKIQSRL